MRIPLAQNNPKIVSAWYTSVRNCEIQISKEFGVIFLYTQLIHCSDLEDPCFWSSDFLDCFEYLTPWGCDERISKAAECYSSQLVSKTITDCPTVMLSQCPLQSPRCEWFENSSLEWCKLTPFNLEVFANYLVNYSMIRPAFYLQVHAIFEYKWLLTNKVLHQVAMQFGRSGKRVTPT